MASDLVVSSSATTHQPEKRPYDVFLSFRGEDTRDNFVSHLYKALCDQQIKTFIDYNLKRGGNFPPALLTAIQESSISIIVFSENYADSKWCLKELVKIMECKNSSGQIVLPVFYRVDRTHVRNLTGNFGAAFHRLQGRSKGKMDLDKVRSHLMEVADISGWDSQTIRQESKLITEIVGDVLRKLNLISFSYSTNLIGIFHHIEKVESLLCLDKPDTCIVGIWGMGGIGKTTIARAVFNHVCGRFDECYLLLNVHDELKKQSVKALRDKLLSNIFEKDCQSMGSQSLRPGFIRRQLEQKKVFIVLDDVNDPKHLKELLGGQDYSFGFGSKILVTSRNRQVLKSVMVTDKIYEVEAMNEKDAMTLFSVNAFKKEYPTSSYEELSLSAINYARGNPLALVDLGSALFDISEDEWLSALEGLMKEPNNNIRNVLMSSFDTLSRAEKQIFLDIACLFCESHRDSIIEYYGKLGIFKIKVLRDNSLITKSSSNTIGMHALLKDMGQSIDQEEHPHKPEKRERLWIPKDVCTVLAKKTGTTKIKAISLDMSGIEEMYLDGDAFRGMESLQYLKFYNNNSRYDEHEKNKVYFSKGCEGLEYLPGGLRYFHWDGFPAKHLPSNFCAENLVELRLDGSKVEKLWTGVQDLRNLRVISLNGCSNLIEIPDLFEAKNLRINLTMCPSLYRDVHFSYSTNLIGIFHHIEKVDSLLCFDKPDICIAGICGMGGIGKTTIARAVFNHICGRFDKCYLLLNVHDELKKKSMKLLSYIFERECQILGSQSLRPDFIRRQLQQKKVLIVLDDVNDPIYLKELLGGQDYSFGLGSKILVTSRDKQVLKNVTDKIYAMETMNEKDAMTLFSVHAFKKMYPTSSFKELSVRVVKHARGNPLALVVLGSALFERSKEEWLSALEGLKKGPNNDIRNMVMISFDTLSREEKQIFLDIACFFCGSDRDSIKEYYGKSGLFKIKSLQDKSLITVSSSNIIGMHDLLRDMGQSIDQEEHPHKPEKRERLWIPKDVCTVLEKKTGTTKIKAISLDMSGIEEMYLDGDAFRGMESLQYLKFYNNNSRYDEHEKNKVYFSKGCEGLEYLPGGLRYFHWDGFPAKHLPSNFCAENLIELHLDGSNVEKLWTGVQDLRNLRVISLIGCSNLIEIPDLSEAKNLWRIDLPQQKQANATPIRNPSKFSSRRRRRWLMIRSCSLSLRLSRTRFQRHHSASSKKRIRSFLSLHSSSYKSLEPKRRRT